jgi:hypothetical protein
MTTPRWAVLVTVLPGPGPWPLVDVTARRVDAGVPAGCSGWTLEVADARVPAGEAAALDVRTFADGRLEGRVVFRPSARRRPFRFNGFLGHLEIRGRHLSLEARLTASRRPPVADGSRIRLRAADVGVPAPFRLESPRGSGDRAGPAPASGR